MKTFEEYLRDRFFKVANPTKDNFEMEFDRWLSELEGEDYIRIADLAMREAYTDGKIEVLNNLK